jgi:hypothetical protein
MGRCAFAWASKAYFARPLAAADRFYAAPVFFFLR